MHSSTLIILIFTSGLLLVPLSADYHKQKISQKYNKILEKIGVPKTKLIGEDKIYRPDGTLASIKKYYSGFVEEEYLYMGEEQKLYAVYYYKEGQLSWVEIHENNNKITTMPITDQTPAAVIAAA